MQINQAQTLKYQKKQMLNVVPKYSYKHEAADHPLVHSPRVISIWNLDVKIYFVLMSAIDDLCICYVESLHDV